MVGALGQFDAAAVAFGDGAGDGVEEGTGEGASSDASGGDVVDEADGMNAPQR